MRRRVRQRAKIILRGELEYNYAYLHLLSFSSLPASPLLCLPLLVLTNLSSLALACFVDVACLVDVCALFA